MGRAANATPIGPIVVAPRRGLSREQAADYIGVGASKFDQMVKDRRMPRPKRIDGRVVWDIRQLDTAFDDLPIEGQSSNDVWSDVAV